MCSSLLPVEMHEKCQDRYVLNDMESIRMFSMYMLMYPIILKTFEIEAIVSWSCQDGERQRGNVFPDKMHNKNVPGNSRSSYLVRFWTGIHIYKYIDETFVRRNEWQMIWGNIQLKIQWIEPKIESVDSMGIKFVRFHQIVQNDIWVTQQPRNGHQGNWDLLDIIQNK